MVFTIVAALALRVMLVRENNRRDKDALVAPRVTQSEYTSEKASASQASLAEGIMHVDRDLTDWEDATFRYSL